MEGIPHAWPQSDPVVQDFETRPNSKEQVEEFGFETSPWGKRSSDPRAEVDPEIESLTRGVLGSVAREVRA